MRSLSKIDGFPMMLLPQDASIGFILKTSMRIHQNQEFQGVRQKNMLGGTLSRNILGENDAESRSRTWDAGRALETYLALRYDHKYYRTCCGGPPNSS